MRTQISVLVYKGVPVDFSKYRHTALRALYSDGQYDWLHVVGSHPFFKFQKDSENPMSEEPIAWITVCTAPNSVTKAKIISACACTSVRNSNSDRDWNCQNWVGDALTELVKIGCLTNEERAAAISKMVETILEAELEDVRYSCPMKNIISANVDLVLVHRMGCFSLYDPLHTLLGYRSEIHAISPHNVEDVHR
ncbi:hypothetical protein AAEP93_001313 [Penicillium crustosum]